MFVALLSSNLLVLLVVLAIIFTVWLTDGKNWNMPSALIVSAIVFGYPALQLIINLSKSI